MDNCQADRRAIEAIGSVLAGSDRPLVVTSGTTMAATPGRAATEDDPCVPSSMMPRSASEEATFEMVSRGVRATVMRLPQVHDRAKQGLITPLIELARAKGVSAYVGDGRNRRTAAHVIDTARLYRLALEKGIAGERFHAVAEEGVPIRDIAEAIGRRINVPVVSKTSDEAQEHFGWFAFFVVGDAPASSAKTRERLGWRPTGPGLIADIEQPY
jgi:nucleoside-diphosphate-sugar epimerase